MVVTQRMVAKAMVAAAAALIVLGMGCLIAGTFSALYAAGPSGHAQFGFALHSWLIGVPMIAAAVLLIVAAG